MKNDAITVTFDTEHLRHRLETRLRELNKSARGASREANLGESTIRNIMEGKSRAPRMSTLLQLARVLDVSLSWFLESSIHEKDETSNKTRSKIDIFSITKAVENRSKVDPSKTMVSLYYPICRADGTYIVELPSRLYTVAPDIGEIKKFHQYVFLARNDTMWPVFRKDDQLFVDPDYPLIADEDYLFRRNNSRDEFAARLARLTGISDDFFSVMMFNPETTMELSRAEWIAHGVRLRIPVKGNESRSD